MSESELQTHWLRRICATHSQTELPWVERLVNMDDAFDNSLEILNHQILLLDDVMTTGSTLNVAARLPQRSRCKQCRGTCAGQENVGLI